MAMVWGGRVGKAKVMELANAAVSQPAAQAGPGPLVRCGAVGAAGRSTMAETGTRGERDRSRDLNWQSAASSSAPPAPASRCREHRQTFNEGSAIRRQSARSSSLCCRLVNCKAWRLLSQLRALRARSFTTLPESASCPTSPSPGLASQSSGLKAAGECTPSADPETDGADTIPRSSLGGAHRVAANDDCRQSR